MRGLTRLFVVVITAITAMVLFSAAVFAASTTTASAATHQSVAVQVVADQTCPPVTHPHSTPVQRRCGQLAQTGQALTLSTTGQPLGRSSRQELLMFLAGLALAGLGGGLIGLRFTSARR